MCHHDTLAHKTYVYSIIYVMYAEKLISMEIAIN